MSKILVALAATGLVQMLAVSPVSAQFRTAQPIVRPDPPPAGFSRSSEQLTLPPVLIERALQRIFDDWNRGTLGAHLSDRFVDANRLTDAIAVGLPADAELELLAIRATSQLEQFVREDDQGRLVLLTRVSVEALTQVRFNDPVTGLQLLQGNQSYTFTVTVQIR